MAAQIKINDANGTEVSLGLVDDPHLTLALHSGHGCTTAHALDLEFRREMGQTSDDPADDAIYQLVAGKGRGEVIETKVRVTYLSTRSQEELGTLELSRASIYSYREDDVGSAVFQRVVIRAGHSRFTPAGGAAPIELRVLAATVRR